MDKQYINKVIKIQRYYRKLKQSVKWSEIRIAKQISIIKQILKHVSYLLDINEISLINHTNCTKELISILTRLHVYHKAVEWYMVSTVKALLSHAFKCVRKYIMRYGSLSIETLLYSIYEELYIPFSVKNYNSIFIPYGCSMTYKVNICKLISFNKSAFSELTPRIELNGCVISYIHGQCKISIHGVVVNDAENYIFCLPPFKSRYHRIMNNTRMNLETSKMFDIKYLNNILIRDFLCFTDDEISEHIKLTSSRYRELQVMPAVVLFQNFLNTNLVNKRQILVILALGNEFMNHKGRFITSRLLSVQKDIFHVISKTICKSLCDVINLGRCTVISQPVKNKMSLKDQIMALNTSKDVKHKALDKLEQMRGRDTDGKAKQYVEGLLRVPFGVYRKEQIFEDTKNFKDLLNRTLKLNIKTETDLINYFQVNTRSKYISKWNELKRKRVMFLKQMKSNFDSIILGQENMKRHFQRLMAHWITGKQGGAVIGLQGPPGVGKTTIVKHGLSKCWIDKNGIPRPFFFIPVGGMSRASTLIGHGYTYAGSSWGRIVSCLQTAKCLNPIIFFDEVDKVSQSEFGREVIGVLTHLTDDTQNTTFYDHYFDGIPIDLSQAILIFSFNHREKVDPILLDRMTIVKAEQLYHLDKIQIGEKYAWPEISRSLGYAPGDIILSENQISSIITNYTCESGVRRFKQLLLEIAEEVNRLRIIGELTNKTPIKLTDEHLKMILSNYTRYHIRKIRCSPQIGVIHGMYATAYGVGGITTIEVCSSEHNIETGQLGNVMKESIKCAKNVAKRLLPNVSPNSNMHIHLPEASTPKDGPSAGTAIALALFSYWSQVILTNKIAITGEIDLTGNVYAIGGLEQKLYGAKNAGIELALIPTENNNTLDMLRTKNRSFEDDTFSIKTISTVQEALEIYMNY